MEPLRVLVVDDLGAARLTLRSALSIVGFSEIDIVGDGREALARIFAQVTERRAVYGLILLDWDMAPIAGYDILRAIRGSDATAESPVMVTFVDPKREALAGALQAGADDCLVKPISPEHLAERLEALTAKKLDAVQAAFAVAFAGSTTDQGKAAALEACRERIGALGGLAPASHLKELAVGRLYHSAGLSRKAEPWLRQAVARRFGDPESHQLLTAVLKALGRIPAGAEEIEAALVREPDSASLKLKLGEAYLKDERYDEAIRLMSDAVRLFELATGARLTAKGKTVLGRAKVGKGEATDDDLLTGEGIGDMEAAMVLDPDLVTACYHLMVAYQKVGLLGKAREMYERVGAITPQDAEGWVDLGKAYLIKGETERALFAFSKGTVVGAGRFDVYDDIAEALYGARRYREALDYLERAKRIDPSSKHVYNLAGVIRRILGDRQEALEEYRMAERLDPSDAGVVFNLGVAYYKAGQGKVSLSYFERAKRLDPTLKEADRYLSLLADGGGA